MKYWQNFASQRNAILIQKPSGMLLKICYNDFEFNDFVKSKIQDLSFDLSEKQAIKVHVVSLARI